MSYTQYSIHIHRDTRLRAEFKGFLANVDRDAFATFEITADDNRVVLFIKRDKLQQFKDVITDALVADGVKDKVATEYVAKEGTVNAPW
jgi:hypothetical protein